MSRSAIITGSANGIGATIAETLSGKGYRVGILDRDSGAVEARCSAVDGAVPLPCDVSDPAAVEAAFDNFGEAPDLLVNNAGIVRFGPLADQSDEDIRLVMEVNTMGVFWTARSATRRMAQRGSGHVISLTSINAYSPGPGSGAYPASKAAVKQLMKQFALEYGEHGVRFNSIAPGFIDGGMSTPIYADPKVRAARSRGVPLGRLGTPEDIANAVAFLDSAEGAYINGHDLVVDGAVTHAVLKNLPRE
ncbi:SDR family NAD(P)-dependent oxidoreductase [Paraurantiacibacter namhicola]|uniref:3-oxoacyl-[acyl-carrier-protein] reductase FabG n=1 Tax=Paraurantiacibacter namhicola TaxID=645517 RepID=A0A1C7DA94_9SPHN|nr:SDR family oxidoreductase [Paraurantiacibacter namhicola]ANU08416.1 3-oxoacyl-[acyl-carrier-protein] reductase FabG [Paraurantiacibacter namhicola]